MIKTSSEFFREARLINNIFYPFSYGLDLAKRYNAILAGGAVRSVFSRETPVDYDLFFMKEQDRIDFEKNFNSENINTLITNSAFGFRIENVFESDNANTYKIIDGAGNKKIFQTIKKIYGQPEEILENFDMRCCKGCYCFGSSLWVYDELFFSDNMAKQVIVSDDLKYPFATLFRMFKYQKKGYYVPPSEIVKVCIASRAVKLDTIYDWKEQMLGIDTVILTALFKQMEADGTDMHAPFDAKFALEYINEFLFKRGLEDDI